MNRLLILLFCFFTIANLNGQRYFSKNAIIRFHSDSPIEKIEAMNSTSSTVFDVVSGKFEIAVLNNAFVFEKALMQEHFNENYMESSKFPKTVFKGTIQNIIDVKFGIEGTYKVIIDGEMNMHGVKKFITIPAELIVDSKGLHGSAIFSIKCSDYDIEIPSLVKDNVSNIIDVKVYVDYTILSQ